VLIVVAVVVAAVIIGVVVAFRRTCIEPIGVVTAAPSAAAAVIVIALADAERVAVGEVGRNRRRVDHKRVPVGRIAWGHVTDGHTPGTLARHGHASFALRADARAGRRTRHLARSVGDALALAAPLA
jgi:hypothetical protein